MRCRCAHYRGLIGGGCLWPGCGEDGVVAEVKCVCGWHSTVEEARRCWLPDLDLDVWSRARGGLTCPWWCAVKRRKGRDEPGEGWLEWVSTVGELFGGGAHERHPMAVGTNDTSGACAYVHAVQETGGVCHCKSANYACLPRFCAASTGLLRYCQSLPRPGHGYLCPPALSRPPSIHCAISVRLPPLPPAPIGKALRYSSMAFLEVCIYVSCRIASMSSLL